MLTERDQQILDFENTWTLNDGAKEGLIRDAFGISAATYYQIVNALLENPAAIEAEPLLIGRLQRLRDARRQARLHYGKH